MTKTWIVTAAWLLAVAPLAVAQTEDPTSDYQRADDREVVDRDAIDDSEPSQERQQEDQASYREQQSQSERGFGRDTFSADRERISSRDSDRAGAGHHESDSPSNRSAARSSDPTFERRALEGYATERPGNDHQGPDSLAEWWSDWWSDEQGASTGIEAANAREFISDHDGDEDGYLSWSELPRDLRSNFNPLDRDGDGYLSQSELSQHANRRARTRIPMEVTYIWVIGADRGKVDLGELQQAYTMLRRIDDDGDGYIARHELHEQQQRVVSQWINHCFDQHDKDYSDAITRQEAAGSMLARGFAHLDQNSDDELTRGELRTAMRQQQAALERQQESQTDADSPATDEQSGRRAAYDNEDDARR